ncbi:MAG: hypothetical protein LBL30_00230 [Holosporales bacterium]|jgi:hypothetical protein|nr:hypothetical protein [Holosporales bacterium]
MKSKALKVGIMLFCHLVISSKIDAALPRLPFHHQKEKVARRLGGFDARSSNAWRELNQRFENVSHRELLSIAYIVSQMTEIPGPDREARRSEAVLVKWFDENCAVIQPCLDLIALTSSDGLNPSGGPLSVPDLSAVSFSYPSEWLSVNPQIAVDQPVSEQAPFLIPPPTQTVIPRVHTRRKRETVMFNETPWDLNYMNNLAYQELLQTYGGCILQFAELRAIIHLVLQNTGMYASSFACGRVSSIVFWLNENWDAIKDHLPPPEAVRELAEQTRENNRIAYAARRARRNSSKERLASVSPLQSHVEED